LAHILLGWEFGGNRGHALRLVQLADKLKARGHQVSFVLQRVDAITPAEAKGSPVWPAPVSPRMLVNAGRPRTGSPSTMGDILARLGFNDSAIVAAALRAWLQLMDAIRPDIVVAEYAPWLLMAARGRVKTVAVGTGFDAPPAEMPRFPSLTRKPPALDEEETLAAVNRALDSIGARRLAALPELFAANTQVAATFTEMDAYAEWRIRPLAMPTVPQPPPGISGGQGTEVFVYAPEQVPIDAPLWKGLAAAKLPVRVHVPLVGEPYYAELARMGFAVERAPVPFALIAQRSRLLVSHGGHGFVCSALLSGLPQVVCHIDLEKLGYAQAVARMRLGGFVPLAQVQPEPFAASLAQLYRDESLSARAREAAPDFHERYTKSLEQTVTEAVEALL